MAPARLSMPLDPIYRGSTWRLPVPFFNEDETPFDLTGGVVTLSMERVGLPRADYEVTGTDLGEGLIQFEGEETVTANWTAGRYGFEVRLAIGGDVLSVLVGTIVVVKGPADGGTDAVLPGAAQSGSIPGVVVSATGLIRVVMVDRVRIGGTADQITVPQELADLFGGSTNLADVLAYIAANLGSAPSPILQTLAGNIVSQAVLSGALSVAAAQQILLTGALSSTTGLTGSLSVGVAGSIALVGTAISTSMASGALSLVAQVALAGTAYGIAGMTGALTVAAAPALALPAISAAPTAGWGMVKLNSEYSGNLFRLIRSTDNATRDIAQGSNGKPDLTGFAAWAGSATIKIDIIYDQYGTNHLTQTTDNLRPFFATADAYRGNHGASMYTGTRWMTIPAAVTGDAYATTGIGVGYAHATGDGAGYLQLGAAYGTDGSRALILGRDEDPRVNVLNKSFLSGERIALAQPQVVALVQSAANDAVHTNNRIVNIAAGSAGTWAGGFVGKNNYGFIGTFYGHAIYPATLSSGDLAALKTAFYSMFDIEPNPSVQIVVPGNSIVQGTSSLRNTWSYPRQAEPLLSQRADIINAGRFGQAASAIYTNRARYSATFRADRARNIIVAPEPTNDIESRTSANVAGFGSAVWTASVLPFIQAMITAGFPAADVLVPTTLPRNFGGTAPLPANKETERVAYNQLVRDNAATYGYTVLDFAGIAALANPSGPNYSDGTHPNSNNYLAGLEVSGNGYGYMAKLFADTVNARLAA